MQKPKSNIKINPENCAQCLSCMLICSFTHFKSFNPSKAHLQIIPGHLVEQTWIPTEIRFLQDCKPTCWLCVEYCAYEALQHLGGT
ncbi:MAG: hypothetical protein LUQ65_02930 [Candidatus Helarchaeota archaeon]|nr:hypothetical protein [Candidatus Helarchaeota archaeon]